MKNRGFLILFIACGACASTAPAPDEPRGEGEPSAETPVSTGADEASLVDGDVLGFADADDDGGEPGPDDEAGSAGIDEGSLPDEGDEEIDDGYGEDEDGTVDQLTWQDLPPHPLAGLSTADLTKRIREDLPSLGPISLGNIHGGALLNGVQLPEGEQWIIRQPNASWGTQETVDGITHCISKVARDFEGTPKLYIGHLSRKRGGRFHPHVSHQNGRDADIGYYYTGGEPWYTYTTEENIDRDRTWALIRCFVTETDVELILSDRRLITTLRDHAIASGEDRHWVHQIMGGNTATMRPIVRHARGHATHLHVRFYSPMARETGRLTYDILVRSKIINPPSVFVTHRARKGHTLAYLAKRYRVSQRDIKRANRMRGTLIREGRVYKIPRRRGVVKIDSPLPVKVPNRRLPPPGRAAGQGGASSQQVNGSP